MMYVQVVRFKWLRRLPEWLIYFHHASLVFPELENEPVTGPIEIEAMPSKGVFIHSWRHPQERMCRDEHLFEVIGYALLEPREPVDIEKVLDYTMGQTGKWYAWHWVLYLIWDVLTKRLSDEIRGLRAEAWGPLRQGPPFQVCTSLVADCLEYAGYPVVEPGKRLVLPDEFWRSPKLRVVEMEGE
jgi:hypothetical protein